MGQCKGTTKAGARCKRSAADDSEFCSIHEPVEEAAEATAEATADAQDADDQAADDQADDRSPALDLVPLLIGAAAAVAMVVILRKVPRFPG